MGNTTIKTKTWNHVVLVRLGRKIEVYLNGNPTPEIAGEMEVGFASSGTGIFVGGRSDNQYNFEGKISDVAIYDRCLTIEEVTRHHG